MLGTHGIKCKKPDDKAWWFLAGQGRTNRLRIHAVRFAPENAEKAIAVLRQDNPEFLFKVIKF